MQNFNYHTHTYRCGHADDNMRDEDFVKELINKERFLEELFELLRIPSISSVSEYADARQKCAESYFLKRWKRYLSELRTVTEGILSDLF